MKNKFLLIIPVVSVVLAVIIFFTLTSKNAEAQSVITLVRESGTVLFKESEEAEYKDMNDDEITITSGSFIKTKENAFARVFLPDNSLISLDQNTEIQVNVEGNKFNINQLIGQTWNRVQSVSSGGEFTIKTPNTIAAVRGTIFGVNVPSSEITYVYVNDGKVEVNRYEVVENEEKIIETITLEKEDIVQVLKDSDVFEFHKFKLDEEWTDHFWFLRNFIIDEIYYRLIAEDVLKLKLNMTTELQNNTNRTIYRFDQKSGTPEMTIDELKEKLGRVIDITQINQDTCKKNTTEDFINATDLLNSYSEYVDGYGQLNDFLTTLTRVCGDQKLSPQEINELRGLVSSFN